MQSDNEKTGDQALTAFESSPRAFRETHLEDTFSGSHLPRPSNGSIAPKWQASGFEAERSLKS